MAGGLAGGPHTAGRTWPRPHPTSHPPGHTPKELQAPCGVDTDIHMPVRECVWVHVRAWGVHEHMSVCERV